MPSSSSAWISAELVESEVALAVEVELVSALVPTEAVRALAELLWVCPLALSSACVSCCSASTRLLSVWLAVVVESAVEAVETVEVAAVDELVEDELLEDEASCSDVRNARAVAAKRSDGEPHGGGGGGPARLDALCVLVA
jgi:hypothetical protein